jgi:uncharacterized membrane protein
MRDLYNRIAAGDVGRVAAISDGVFAFAATMLVLDVRSPEPGEIHSEGQLLSALAAQGPHWLSWLMSLMTLGIFWVGQQTQLNQIRRADRDFTWVSLLFLAFVTALPFSTRILADFFSFRTALVIYWANILLCGACLYATWICARSRDLLAEDMTPQTDRAIRRRIEIAQALYFVGMLLGLVHTLIGVGFIIAVQLNYALAPFRVFETSGRSRAGGETGGG